MDFFKRLMNRVYSFFGIKQIKTCQEKHQHFIGVQDVVDRFPEEYKTDEDLLNLVKHMCDLTVHIQISKGESGFLHGTGFIQRVRTARGIKCPDRNCSLRGKSHAWVVVTVTTVYHVVETQGYAELAEITLNFDQDVPPSPSCRGCKLLESDKETDHYDWCAVECESHELDLEEKLKSCISSLEELQRATYERYKGADPRLVVVVGHPHGGPKKVTFGKWTKKDILKEIRSNQDWCRYVHTSATCPGSSGSPVFILGQPLCGYGYWFGHPHNHSGRAPDDSVAFTSIGSEHLQ
ncbi:uncharacterized protein LOC106050991 [Biomphalaria glabrata]|uniref:Uncharacterized protein LOC106050991 n=1 Tax=Biomphalaria glabrata TaxID=6526 RepID=A0A9U8DUD5_BIOGL|nr:uncharacterized protein LOC106050991 [Biomphalaria glabrata]